jgi:hypothetical protein
VSGIVTDIQDLVKQQLRLTRREIEDDLHKSKEGASVLGLGLGIAFLGGFLFCLMLVYLLHWLTLPPGTDTAGFPLWACYGVVALLFFIVGGALAAIGGQKLKTLHPLENTSEALKENVQWLTKPK